MWIIPSFSTSAKHKRCSKCGGGGDKVVVKNKRNQYNITSSWPNSEHKRTNKAPKQPLSKTHRGDTSQRAFCISRKSKVCVRSVKVHNRAVDHVGETQHKVRQTESREHKGDRGPEVSPSLTSSEKHDIWLASLTPKGANQQLTTVDVVDTWWERKTHWYYIHLPGL